MLASSEATAAGKYVNILKFCCCCSLQWLSIYWPVVSIFGVLCGRVCCSLKRKSSDRNHEYRFFWGTKGIFIIQVQREHSRACDSTMNRKVQSTSWTSINCLRHAQPSWFYFCFFIICIHPGLPLGLETPFMTPSGLDFSLLIRMHLTRFLL